MENTILPKVEFLHSMMAVFCAINMMLQPADWMEFSPYEIGMAKYGTFMTPDLFGSKFFMGTVIKKYEENPLHFLMGKKDVFISDTRQTISKPANSMVSLCQVCGGVRFLFCSTECWESKTQLVAAPWRRS